MLYRDWNIIQSLGTAIQNAYKVFTICKRFSILVFVIK